MASHPQQRCAWLATSRGCWLAAAAAVALLHLTHPLTWGCPPPAFWLPPAGLGLALVAWLGPRRGSPLLLAAGGVLLAQAGVMRAFGRAGDVPPLPYLAAEVLLGLAAVHAGWWLYHRAARGARRLGDPRSAILFLMLIPGLTGGLFAPARVLLARAAGLPGAEGPFGPALALFWLDWSLGVLALAPPLLVALTPWLTRRGLAAGEEWGANPWGEWSRRDASGPAGTGQLIGDRPARAPFSWGDATELAGLAAGARSSACC